MAEPVEFDEQNTTWIGQGDVDELPAFRDIASGENISCWRLNPAELAEVQRTGVVWLRVWGVHPPVYVDGFHPFIPEVAAA